MKNFELIKAGQPSEVEILSVYAMNDIIGGGDYVRCSKGYKSKGGGSCKCGYVLVQEISDSIRVEPIK